MRTERASRLLSHALSSVVYKLDPESVTECYENLRQDAHAAAAVARREDAELAKAYAPARQAHMSVVDILRTDALREHIKVVVSAHPDAMFTVSVARKAITSISEYFGAPLPQAQSQELDGEPMQHEGEAGHGVNSGQAVLPDVPDAPEPEPLALVAFSVIRARPTMVRRVKVPGSSAQPLRNTEMLIAPRECSILDADGREMLVVSNKPALQVHDRSDIVAFLSLASDSEQTTHAMKRLQMWPRRCGVSFRFPAPLASSSPLITQLVQNHLSGGVLCEEASAMILLRGWEQSGVVKSGPSGRWMLTELGMSTLEDSLHFTDSVLVADFRQGVQWAEKTLWELLQQLDAQHFRWRSKGRTKARPYLPTDSACEKIWFSVGKEHPRVSKQYLIALLTVEVGLGAWKLIPSRSVCVCFSQLYKSVVTCRGRRSCLRSKLFSRLERLPLPTLKKPRRICTNVQPYVTGVVGTR